MMCLVIYSSNKDLSCAYSVPHTETPVVSKTNIVPALCENSVGRTVHSMNNLQKLGFGICWSEFMVLGGPVKENGPNVAYGSKVSTYFER